MYTRPATSQEIHAHGLRDTGLTPVDDAVLGHLSGHDACTARGIAEATGLHVSVAERVGWRLVEAGYALRVGDAFLVA